MNRLDIVRQQVEASVKAKEAMLADESLMKQIASLAEVCTEAYRRGNKVLWCGNGGSAADAQHMAGELVSRFYFDRPALPSLSLSTDPSIVTAISNDYGYEDVFAHQVQAWGQKGDILIGISTSGNSRNILAAGEVCREKGLTTVALTGAKPCAMDSFDIVLKMPSSETPRIQECQTLTGHILCCIIEENLFGHLK